MPRPASASFASRGRLAVTFVVVVAALAGVQPASADDPADRLADARAAVDDVAQQFFDMQEELFGIDQEIALIEDEIAVAESRAAQLRRVATERAVEMYKANDAVIDEVLADDALDAARRIELIDRANARNEDAFRALGAATDDLEQRRAALEGRRAEQETALRALEGRQTELRELLDAARAAYLAAQEVERSRPRALATAAPPSTGPGTSAATDAPASEAPPSPVPAPAPPPPSSGIHPHHDDPFLVCTRQRESGGDYGAVSPAGYYGAYQFALTTWDATASHAGRPGLLGVSPHTASVYDQDDMAWTLYQWQGKRPWGNRC